MLSAHKCEHVHILNNEHHGELIEKARAFISSIFISLAKKKEVFQHRLKNVHQLLTLPDSQSLDNYSLFKTTV